MRYAIVEGRGTLKTITAVLPPNFRVITSVTAIDTGRVTAILGGLVDDRSELEDVMAALRAARIFGHEFDLADTEATSDDVYVDRSPNF